MKLCYPTIYYTYYKESLLSLEQAGAELCQAHISFQLAMKASIIRNLAVDVLNEIKRDL